MMFFKRCVISLFQKIEISFFMKQKNRTKYFSAILNIVLNYFRYLER